jgi:23S rRNA pseudouridine2605 synthase
VFLAKAGIASRRAAEDMIRDGRVSVNGQVVTQMGAKCLPGDTVLVDGKPARQEETLRHILLNKPRGYICTSRDDFGRPLALDLVQPHFTERLYSVGRLDFESSGLIILTNDGEFAKSLSHPSSELEKEYLVEAHTRIPLELARVFQAGITLDGVTYTAKSCRHEGDKSMSIVLVEGKNREIRRVFKDFGLEIISLTRIRIMNVRLEGLREGSYRHLSPTEIEEFKRACGEKGQGSGRGNDGSRD